MLNLIRTSHSLACPDKRSCNTFHLLSLPVYLLLFIHKSRCHSMNFSLIQKIEKLILSLNITRNITYPTKGGVTFNCPITLAFLVVVFIVQLAFQTNFSDLFHNLFSVSKPFEWANSSSYLSLLLFVFSDDGKWQNISNPLLLIVLIGPIVEERVGPIQLVVAGIATTLITSLLHAILFSSNLYGPTCLAYMLVFMASYVNVRKGHAPLSFILVLVLVVLVSADQWTEDLRTAFPMITGSLMGWFWARMTSRVLPQASS
jgi:rhomboid protease GluP